VRRRIRAGYGAGPLPRPAAQSVPAPYDDRAGLL